VVLALGRWGSRAPFPPRAGHLSVDALMLALRTLFDRSAAEGLTTSYELRLREHRFHARIADGELELTTGSAEKPDVIIDTDPATLSAVLWHGRRLADAEAAGTVKIEGRRRAGARFVKLFPPPQPVATSVPDE
jgi:alkyl sulfatase BDS1-like metallo-beta-lactamase superfamily hydrolase